MRNYIFRLYFIFVLFATFNSCESPENKGDKNDDKVLEFVNSNLTISSLTQSFVIEATTSLDGYVVANKPDWVSETNSVEATKRKFIASANKSGERSGEIILKKQNSTTESKFVITQEGFSVSNIILLSIVKNEAIPLSVSARVKYNGGIPNDEKLLDIGICYGREENPDVRNRRIIGNPTSNPMENIPMSGVFNIESLHHDKTYNFRPYIKTDKGIYYGESVNYKTESISRDNNFTPLLTIFHVFHSGEATSQNVKTEIIEDAVEHTNILFRSVYNRASTDLNIELILAEKSPTGELLKERGIVRHNIGGDGIIDGINILKSFDTYNQYMWDPEKYLNVWVCDYGENSRISGISTMNYVPKNYPLVGITATDWFATNKLDRMVGITLNSNPLLTVSELSTLAHECGHTLGLLHAFGEDDYGNVGCEFDDYCKDTPNYDRKIYIDQIDALQYNRIKCNSTETFVSTNIMDYYYSYCSQFTPQQRERVQHILNYGIFIPRSKSKSLIYEITTPDDGRPPLILK